MSSRHSSLSPRFGVALAVVIIVASLVGGAFAAESLPAPAYVADAPAETKRLGTPTVPASSGPCDEQTRRCDDEYVFAATRSLRQSGIEPAIAVALAPATLLVDAVFFPFALALDHLVN